MEQLGLGILLKDNKKVVVLLPHFVCSNFEGFLKKKYKSRQQTYANDSL